MEWRDVAGWKGIYKVASDGSIIRFDGFIPGQWPNWCGYMLVRFSNPRKTVFVHRLVAGAFIENPDGLPFVNHIDCHVSNNDASNLEWCTQRHNLEHMTKLGRRAKPNIGKRSPSATLSEETVSRIYWDRHLLRLSHMELAKKHGTNKTTVGRILSGKSYCHLPNPPKHNGE